jgi:predicted metal-dependent TIM-barrel fold hydrolase
MKFDQIKKNLSEEIKTITEIGNILNNLERIPSEEQGVFQRQLQLLEEIWK